MEDLRRILEFETKRIIKVLGRHYKLNEAEAFESVQLVQKKRGRPRIEKNKGEQVRGRGRPPMEQKVKTSNVGEDLIGRLIAKAKKDTLEL
jgi:hypothetical protein